MTTARNNRTLSLEGESRVGKSSFPHNKVLISIHASLFIDACYFGQIIKNIIFLELFFLFYLCSLQIRRDLSLRNLFYSFWIWTIMDSFLIVYLQFIWKLAINIHHCSFGCYVFHPMKKKLTKSYKNLLDFSRSKDISFTLLTLTQNIVKSDFTSLLEAISTCNLVSILA